MALGLTEPLTEMRTRNISWGGERRPVRMADNLTTFMCRFLEIWEPQPPGTLRPVIGLFYLYPLMSVDWYRHM